MSDREAMKLALEALEWAWGGEPMGTKEQASMQAHRTALAAPRPEPVATVGTQSNDFWKGFNGKWVPPAEPTKMVHLLRDLPVGTLLYTAPPAAAPEPVRHPGYVIGNHWLETAYSRICAGEAEADVLRDIGLVREEAFLTGVAHLKAENEALRRDAERYRWLRGEHSRIDPCIKANAKYKLERQSSTWVEIHDLDAAIDAAMQEDKT